MNDEIAALRAMVSDLASEVRTRSNSPVRGEETAITASSVAHPFWDVTVCTGLALNDTDPPTDWEPLFVPTATNWRKTHLSTAHGEINLNDFGIGFQRLFTITWDAAQASTVKAAILGYNAAGGDTDGVIQYKLNGVVTDIATPTPQTLTLQIKPGRNRLSIAMSTNPDTLTFLGILWDETRGDKWVDPRTLPGYLRSTT